MSRNRIRLPGLAVFALAAALPGCRSDMQDTPKAKTFRASRFYDDQMTARQLVAGTVPATGLANDELRYNGVVNGRVATEFPFPITRQVLARGQERYNIFCSPCHGRLGDGDGMIVRRGFRRPPSYHIDRLRKAPVGHFYDVITHGFGSMYDYADRVPPRDRWAIIAYIRALQLSQNATLADLPPQERAQLAGERP
jgi:mono/diheme cytochrome c family protein